MARPTTARFGAFVVALSAGGSPETFVAPCGFTSKALTLSKNLSEVAIPDCDDPDAAFWIARDVQTLSASVSGDGLLAAESVQVWKAAAKSTESINVRVSIAFTTGTLAYVGLMHLESFTINGDQGGRVSASISMQSDGEMVDSWTAAG